MPNKPVRLRQKDSKNRLAFWVSVSLAVIVVVAVWVKVIHRAIYADFIVIREQIEETFDRAAEEIVELSGETREIREFGEEFSENFEEFENAYAEERERQQALEENETN
mgnify:CR=1 FL=1